VTRDTAMQLRVRVYLKELSMRRTILMTMAGALLFAAIPQIASAIPLVSGGASTTAAESFSPVETSITTAMGAVIMAAMVAMAAVTMADADITDTGN
jgi:hypothetical protein